MKQGIGETFTYNLIIVFIIIVFALLSAAISYYKAFTVNSRILSSIEKYEGYNDLARAEITRTLNIIGYTKDNETCETRAGITPEKQDKTYYYCVYRYDNDTGGSDKNLRNKSGEWLYSNYAVVTHIYLDLPLLNMIKIPIYTKGERIYNFSQQGSDNS